MLKSIYNRIMKRLSFDVHGNLVSLLKDSDILEGIAILLAENIDKAKIVESLEFKLDAKLNERLNLTIGNETIIYIAHTMPKSGSTSLGDALILLNKASVDHQWRPELYEKFKNVIDSSNILISDFLHYSLIPEYIKYSIRSMYSELMEEISEYNLFTDFPIGHIKIHPFIKKILYPKCKLIWNDRELKTWLKSVEKWELLHPENYKDGNVRWGVDREKTIDEMLFKYNSERTKLEELQKDFPDDILFRDIGDQWSDLCVFLDVETPEFDFPVSNVNQGSLRE